MIISNRMEVIFLAMDLIEGPSLKARLSEVGGVSPNQVTAWAKQILDALECMHRQGIIHRDIKPDNIRLEGDKIFLTDFGLAKERVAGTMVPGHTPDYSAPRTVRRRKQRGHAKARF